MPLSPGYDPKTISKNIAIERRQGKPAKQAVAIAYSAARKAAKKADPHKRAALMKRLEEK